MPSVVMMVKERKSKNLKKQHTRFKLKQSSLNIARLHFVTLLLLLNDEDEKMSTISVIIPCYNEAESTERTVMRVIEASIEKHLAQIIVVDGGSTDGTMQALENLIQNHSKLVSYVCLDRPSRGRQLITVANLANSSILLFLHADTLLPQQWDKVIVKAFEARKDQHYLIGCFQLSLPPPLTASLFIMVWTANLRAKIAITLR